MSTAAAQALAEIKKLRNNELTNINQRLANIEEQLARIEFQSDTALKGLAIFAEELTKNPPS